MNPELDEKLSALLDGELAPEEAAALRAELARSPELAARLAALAAVDDGLRDLPARGLPPGLRARVAETLRTPASRVRAPRAARRARRWLAAAALAAAAAALALLALPRAPRDETPVARIELPRQLAPVAPIEPPVRVAPAPAPREELAEAEDLPVIQVLDVLAELDELEPAGSG